MCQSGPARGLAEHDCVVAGCHSVSCAISTTRLSNGMALGKFAGWMDFTIDGCKKGTKEGYFFSSFALAS
jgi:hypothetical protein